MSDERQPERPQERGAMELAQTAALIVVATPTAIDLGGQVKDKFKKKK